MPLFKRLHLAFTAPLLFLPTGAGLHAAPDGARPRVLRPLMPPPPQALRRVAPLTAPPAQRGPGDTIPPCVLVYGWTSQGPTDRTGNLISLPLAVHLPRTYLIGQAAAQRR